METKESCWNWTDDELSSAGQRHTLMLNQPGRLADSIRSHMSVKLRGYKTQDQRHRWFDPNQFITLDQTVALLRRQDMNCAYCFEPMLLLYSFAMDGKQWSLDRIDNFQGHNVDNVVGACLSCNLRRRRTNKDDFYFTTNLVITKEEDKNDEDNDDKNQDKDKDNGIV